MRRTIKRLVMLAATAGFLMLPAAATPALAKDTDNDNGPKDVTCHSNDILTGTYRNVTVPPGNYCLLLGASVTESVHADGSIQIGIDNSKIGDSVFASNVQQNGWVCGSTVGKDIIVRNAASGGTNPPAWYLGESSWCVPQFDPVPGNYVGGHVTLDDNHSPLFVSNNDIESNLTCTDNNPAPTGSNNTVDGKNKGQCKTLGGGAEDSFSPTDKD